MKEEKKQPTDQPSGKKKLLREDDGKRTPPAHMEFLTRKETPANKPEQGPDVPPHERTEGIP
ncbi:hypothetical protein OB13_15585 [Pontibacter sp. HJ8]